MKDSDLIDYQIDDQEQATGQSSRRPERCIDAITIPHRNRRRLCHRVRAGHWSIEVSPLARGPETGASHQEKDLALNSSNEINHHTP